LTFCLHVVKLNLLNGQAWTIFRGQKKATDPNCGKTGKIPAADTKAVANSGPLLDHAVATPCFGGAEEDNQFLAKN
jgi:hypothetical protein